MMIELPHDRAYESTTRGAGLPQLLLAAALAFMMMFPISAWGASDSGKVEHFNLLTAPAAPGFVLLGVEPASVQTPAAPADVAVTILTQTDNLTTIPEDFAVEIAPFWMLGGSGLTYSQYAGNQGLWANFLQTLSLSMASSSRSVSSDDTTASSVAFGARFCLFQGHIDESHEQYGARLDSIRENLRYLNRSMHDAWTSRKESDSLLLQLKRLRDAVPDSLKAGIYDMMDDRRSSLLNEVEAEQAELHEDEHELLADLASRLTVRRIGPVLQASMGVVVDFPDRDFDYGDLSRAGLWLTGGYTWDDWSALAVARYLHHDEDSLCNFDFGARLIFDNWRRFSLSAEGLYRRFPDRDSDESTWRAAFALDYAIGKNKSIAITFGRDFEGRRSGNLLTLINLVLGFGSERPKP